MSYLEILSEFLGKVALKIAAIIMIYMVSHIVLEIILRSFFSVSTHVLDEFVGYATAAITFLSMSYSMRNGSLIQVGLVLSKLQGFTRKAFEIFGLSTTLIVACFLTYFFWTKVFWRNIVRERVSNSIAEIPLYIPESFVIIGLILFAFQVFVLLLKTFQGSAESSG